MDTNRDADRLSSDRADVGGLTSVEESKKPYDASLDPRTGRPPNPLEAQRLAREHEAERGENAKAGSADHENGDVADPAFQSGDAEASALAHEQAPARMKSPARDEGERVAADALVQEGITREHAEQLVSAHGTDWETLKSAAWPENMKTEASDVDTEMTERKSALREHHKEGIPPFDTPGIKE